MSGQKYIPMVMGILILLVTACSTQAPTWLIGKSDLYPHDSYFTGVGFGRDLAEAENMARAEIAKIFSVHIQATDSSMESFWLSHVSGAAGEYEQSVSSHLVSSTDKIIAGIEVADTFLNSANGKYYALVVLDRQRMVRKLRSSLAGLAIGINGNMDRAAKASNPLFKLSYYLQALRAAEQRRNLNAELQVVDLSGFVPPDAHSLAEIAGLADEVAVDIRLGLDVEGDPQDIVSGAITHALSSLGISTVNAGSKDLTLQVKVSLSANEYREPWHSTIASAQVQIVNADGTTLDSLRTTVREGSRNKERTENLAFTSLGKKIAELLLDRIVDFGLTSQK